MIRRLVYNRKCSDWVRAAIVAGAIILIYTQFKMYQSGTTPGSSPLHIHGNLLHSALMNAKKKPVTVKPPITVEQFKGPTSAKPKISHADGAGTPKAHEEKLNKAHASITRVTTKEVKGSAANIQITSKEISTKQQGYPRDPVRNIQDIQDKAYEKARTPEFKKNVEKNARKGRRYANNGHNNISDEVVTVILLPHSHNDPGWLWTFDMYHNQYTKNMFDNLVQFLQEENSEMPFQWSESVSLLRWYSQVSNKSRDTIKTAIKNKNLLIDHGSWSMPDEASTTLYSLVENLILGHTWIDSEFGVKPEYSWSNDPFGHSSTIPYLLKQSGIRAMVINRIDMLLKKEMRENQLLEFYWRQAAAADMNDESTDMFTHVLPYMLYNTGESFGPDHKLAKLYDFSPVENMYTPLVDYRTGKGTQNTMKVEERARLLAEQIHLRSALYKHNVILSPIGDDFRYITYPEFCGVHKNWNYLMNYYKRTPEHKVRLQFGTLADYFSLVEEDLKRHSYPVLSGDFFPYSDNSDDKPHDIPPDGNEKTAVYWTGYFTTRPYLKVALRRLENGLRQTEILYSLYKLKTGITGGLMTPPTKTLSKSRETLAWLLHHDAITGTSPTMTINDFMAHLTPAIARLEKFTMRIMELVSRPQSTVDRLTRTANKDKPSLIGSSDDIILDTSPHVLLIAQSVKEETRKALLIGGNGDERIFTLFNSLVQEVKTVAHIKLQVPKTLTTFQLVEVITGRNVICQLNPFITQSGIIEDYLELAFEVTIPALGMKTFRLTTESNADQIANCLLPPVDVFVEKSQVGRITTLKGRTGFTLQPVLKSSGSIKLTTSLNEVAVSSANGTLQSIKSGKNGGFLAIKQTFGVYNKGQGQRNLENGIYMFTAKDEGSSLASSPDDLGFYIKGPVELVTTSWGTKVIQILRVNNVEHGVSVTQRVELSPDVGDLFTRIRSEEVKSADRFYTDSNAFTMVKRTRHYPSRPLASNYYPMTSAMYIEDEVHRLTLVSAQPLGVSSLHSGELEVMLDRRYARYDHGGVTDSMMDKTPTILQFRLLVEKVDSSQVKLPALTSTALHHSLKISYPVSAFSGITAPTDTTSLVLLPCDYHMINLRSLDTLPYGHAKQSDQHSLALVLQRFSTAYSAADHQARPCSKVDKVLLHLPAGYNIERTTLSLLHSLEKIKPENIFLQPDTLQSYKISYSRGT